MSLFAHIGNTVFFMYQHKYSKDWDVKLNHLIEQFGESAKAGKHVIELGEWEVWIANKWYAYGNAYRKAGESVDKTAQFRPSIFTMMRLDDLVQRKEKERVESLVKTLYKSA